MARNSRDRQLAATPRSRGALTGFLLLLLGAWGALIPFIGPYVHYDYTPTNHWTLTSARFFLEVVPGAVTLLGGLLLLRAGNRFTASIGGYLAVAAGAWFIIGPLLAPVFRSNYLGHPVGGAGRAAVEQIGFFYGLGGAIILLAAFALGRFSVIGVRDGAVGEKRAARTDRQTAMREPIVLPEDSTTEATEPSSSSAQAVRKPVRSSRTH